MITAKLPIAILSSNYNKTIDWINKEYDVKEINVTERRITLVNGDILVIISHMAMLLGYEFDSYRKAPDFETLENLVKLRIRN